MKTIIEYALLLATSILMEGCAKSLSSPSNQAHAMRITASERLSLSEATVLVRQEIFRLTPTMNPSADFPLKELTTSEVWDRLHAQVFAVTSGARVCQAYVTQNRQVHPLGEGFGGSGVMSMCVADLNGPGQPGLVFSYSWGSGEHRSIVAIWTGGATWTDAKPALLEHDLWLERTDDQHIHVAYGKFSSTHGFKREGEFGTLQLAGDTTSQHLEIVLDPHLPADVFERIMK